MLQKMPHEVLALRLFFEKESKEEGVVTPPEEGVREVEDESLGMSKGWKECEEEGVEDREAH